MVKNKIFVLLIALNDSRLDIEAFLQITDRQFDKLVDCECNGDWDLKIINLPDDTTGSFEWKKFKDFVRENKETLSWLGYRE